MTCRPRQPAMWSGETYFFLETLRVFFAVFFTALFAFFFAFLAIVPSDVDGLIAACIRESKCTSFRIHQQIEKNSVQLKEVLMQVVGNTSRASMDDTCRGKQKNKRVVCIDESQD